MTLYKYINKHSICLKNNNTGTVSAQKKNTAPLHFRCSYAAVAPFSCS